MPEYREMLTSSNNSKKSNMKMLKNCQEICYSYKKYYKCQKSYKYFVGVTKNVKKKPTEMSIQVKMSIGNKKLL